jgi:RimJ/RimL family protein N-acetyltransferase
MTIITDRLLLRPWEISDAPACFALASDSEVGPCCGWRPHRSLEESREIIRNVLMAPDVYAIIESSSGALIGSLGLHPVKNGAENELELGYWLGRPYWGRGYMPEAVRAALRHAFEELACPAVWCELFRENIRSHRVVESCGFRRVPELDYDVVLYNGLHHHMDVYCMRSEEWRERHG